MVYMDLGTIIDSVTRLAFGILAENIYRASYNMRYLLYVYSINREVDRRKHI